MNGARSESVTGFADDGVTMMPTTCSVSLRGGPAPGPDPGGFPSDKASAGRRLPTCTCRLAAASWVTAISPGRSCRGSLPVRILGMSSSRPNRPSSGASVTAARFSRPPGPTGSTFRPTTGAIRRTPRSLASARS